MLLKSLKTPAFGRVASLALGGTVGLGSSTLAYAGPNQGHFVAGIEAQGPASTHLSAVFHNPAMLTDLPGLHMHLGMKAKMITQRTAVAQRDPKGQPVFNAYDPEQRHRNLGADGFLAASFLFENFAVAAAYYSLEGKYQESAPQGLGSFVRSNPSPYCRILPGKTCPEESGFAGWAEVRSEFTIAVAWQTIRRLRLGVSLHFPRYSLRGTRRRDEGTQATQGLCKRFFPDDPSCEEVEQYRFRTRVRGKDPAGSRIQLGLTAGIAWAPTPRWTFGARFRMRPNFGLRAPIHQGTLRGCAVSQDGRVQCEPLADSHAQLTDQPGRQVALGASYRPFGDRRLHFDVQGYWVQNCPDKQYGRGCQSLPDSEVSVLGAQAAPRIVERPWFRGLQDRWGAELWMHQSLQRHARPRLRRLAYTAGLGGYSASVHPSAHNPIDSDGTNFFAAASVSIELLRRNASLFLVGGYAINWQRPREVGNGGARPAFMPGAFQVVQDQAEGIDGPSGRAVMTGRAQTSNAGLYRSLGQHASVALRWGARE